MAAEPEPATIVVTAVVPARNEERRIGQTVAELRAYVDEVVVVDDRSTDATADRARASGAVVVGNTGRPGYVGAIRQGFAAAGGQVIVTVDADGEMPVEMIPALVRPILDGRADMVQGRRARAPRLSEGIISGVARIGGRVGDSGTGFRALRSELAAGLTIPGSCICGSLALEALALGARLAEVPITLRSAPGHRSVAWYHGRQLLLVLRMALALRAARRRRGSSPG